MSNDTDLQEQVTPGTVADRAKLFRGLADPSRLAILEVGQIVAATGLSQPNASNHLRCLSECGLVAGEARGRFVDYRLADLRIDELLALATELLDGPARGVDACKSYRASP